MSNNENTKENLEPATGSQTDNNGNKSLQRETIAEACNRSVRNGVFRVIRFQSVLYEFTYPDVRRDYLRGLFDVPDNTQNMLAS